MPSPPGLLDVDALMQTYKFYMAIVLNHINRDRSQNSRFNFNQMDHFHRMVCKTFREVRLGRIHNLSLRIKAWVLSSKARRLQLRAAIGEAKIARWQTHWQSQARDMFAPILPVKERQTSGQKTDPDNPGQIGKTRKTGSILYAPEKTMNSDYGSLFSPWYCLPTLPGKAKDITFNFPVMTGFCNPMGDICNDRQLRAALERAFPPVAFWPHELVADYTPVDEARGVLPSGLSNNSTNEETVADAHENLDKNVHKCQTETQKYSPSAHVFDNKSDKSSDQDPSISIGQKPP